MDVSGGAENPPTASPPVRQSSCSNLHIGVKRDTGGEIVVEEGHTLRNAALPDAKNRDSAELMLNSPPVSTLTTATQKWPHNAAQIAVCNTRSITAAAFSCIDGRTCEYRSMAMLEWPSSSLTTLAGTFWSSRVAAVWRRSCSRSGGNPGRFSKGRNEHLLHS